MKSLAVRGRLSGAGSGEAQPIHDAANASQTVNNANRIAIVSVCLLPFSSFILQPSSFRYCNSGRGSPMNSEAVLGGSGGGAFFANGFHDDALSAGFGFTGCEPSLNVVSGFGLDLKMLLVLAIMLDVPEPILLNIDG